MLGSEQSEKREERREDGGGQISDIKSRTTEDEGHIC